MSFASAYKEITRGAGKKSRKKITEDTSRFERMLDAISNGGNIRGFKKPNGTYVEGSFAKKKFVFPENSPILDPYQAQRLASPITAPLPLVMDREKVLRDGGKLGNQQVVPPAFENAVKAWGAPGEALIKDRQIITAKNNADEAHRRLQAANKDFQTEYEKTNPIVKVLGLAGITGADTWAANEFSHNLATGKYGKQYVDPTAVWLSKPSKSKAGALVKTIADNAYSALPAGSRASLIKRSINGDASGIPTIGMNPTDAAITGASPEEAKRLEGILGGIRKSQYEKARLGRDTIGASESLTAHGWARGDGKSKARFAATFAGDMVNDYGNFLQLGSIGAGTKAVRNLVEEAAKTGSTNLVRQAGMKAAKEGVNPKVVNQAFDIATTPVKDVSKTLDPRATGKSIARHLDKIGAKDTADSLRNAVVAEQNPRTISSIIDSINGINPDVAKREILKEAKRVGYGDGTQILNGKADNFGVYGRNAIESNIIDAGLRRASDEFGGYGLDWFTGSNMNLPGSKALGRAIDIPLTDFRRGVSGAADKVQFLRSARDFFDPRVLAGKGKLGDTKVAMGMASVAAAKRSAQEGASHFRNKAEKDAGGKLTNMQREVVAGIAQKEYPRYQKDLLGGNIGLNGVDNAATPQTERNLADPTTIPTQQSHSRATSILGLNETPSRTLPNGYSVYDSADGSSRQFVLDDISTTAITKTENGFEVFDYSNGDVIGTYPDYSQALVKAEAQRVEPRIQHRDIPRITLSGTHANQTIPQYPTVDLPPVDDSAVPNEIGLVSADSGSVNYGGFDWNPVDFNYNGTARGWHVETPSGNLYITHASGFPEFNIPRGFRVFEESTLAPVGEGGLGGSLGRETVGFSEALSRIHDYANRTPLGTSVSKNGFHTNTFTTPYTPLELANSGYRNISDFDKNIDPTNAVGLDDKQIQVGLDSGETLYRYNSEGDILNRSYKDDPRIANLQWYDPETNDWYPVVEPTGIQRRAKRSEGKNYIAKYDDKAAEEFNSGKTPIAYHRAETDGYGLNTVTGQHLTAEDFKDLNEQLVFNPGSLKPYENIRIGYETISNPSDYTHLGDNVFMRENVGKPYTEYSIVAPQIFGSMNITVDNPNKEIYIDWLGAGAAKMAASDMEKSAVAGRTVLETGEVGLGVESMIGRAVRALEKKYPGYTLTTTPGSTMVDHSYQRMGFTPKASNVGLGSLQYPLEGGRAFYNDVVGSVRGNPSPMAVSRFTNNDTGVRLGLGVNEDKLFGGSRVGVSTSRTPIQQFLQTVQDRNPVTNNTGNLLQRISGNVANVPELIKQDGTITTAGHALVKMLEDQQKMAEQSLSNAGQKLLDVNPVDLYQPSRMPIDKAREKMSRTIADLLYGQDNLVEPDKVSFPNRNDVVTSAGDRLNLARGSIDTPYGSFQKSKSYPSPANRLNAGKITETNPYRANEQVMVEQNTLGAQEQQLRELASTFGRRLKFGENRRAGERLVQLQDGSSYALPKQVADDVERLVQTGNIIEPSKNPFAGAWNAANRELLPLMTVARPAFTGVNQIGNIIFNARNGYGRQLPEALRLQASLIANGGDINRISNEADRAILQAAQDSGAINALDFNPSTVYDPSHNSNIMKAPVIGQAMTWNQRLNAAGENLFRLTPFLEEMKRNGGNPMAARMAVDDAMMNYDINALSLPEQAIRKAVPFYTFARRNVPSTAEYYAKHPFRLSWMQKYATNAGSPENEDQSQMKQFMPPDRRGQVNYKVDNARGINNSNLGESMVTLRAPEAEALNYINALYQGVQGNPATAAEIARSSMSPIIGMGAQMIAGQSKTGSSIMNEDSAKGSLLKALIASTPQVGGLYNAINKQAKPEERGGDPMAVNRYITNQITPMPTFDYNPAAWYRAGINNTASTLNDAIQADKNKSFIDQWLSDKFGSNDKPIPDISPDKQSATDFLRELKSNHNASQDAKATSFKDEEKVRHIIANFQKRTKTGKIGGEAINLTFSQQELLRKTNPTAYRWWVKEGRKMPSNVNER